MESGIKMANGCIIKWILKTSIESTNANEYDLFIQSNAEKSNSYHVIVAVADRSTVFY